MTGNDDEVGITEEELKGILAEQKCSVGVMTSLKKLIASFASVKLFLGASEAELRRHGRCGERMLELIGDIRERCYFLEKHKEERFRYNKSFARFLEERDRRMALEIERLNPVFSASDLQVATLFLGEEKLEYIDLRRLNDIRHAITSAQREEMERRYKAEKEERARREVEERTRLEKERAERTAKENAVKDVQEKGAKAPRK